MWPDGQPVSPAMIELEHPENGRIYPRSTAGLRPLLTDKQGFAAFETFEGGSYMVTVTARRADGQYHTLRAPIVGTPDAVVVLHLK